MNGQKIRWNWKSPKLKDAEAIPHPNVPPIAGTPKSVRRVNTVLSYDFEKLLSEVLLREG